MLIQSYNYTWKHISAGLVKNVKLKVTGHSCKQIFWNAKKYWKIGNSDIPRTPLVATVLGAKAAEKFALPGAVGEKGSMWRPDSNTAVSQLGFFPFLRSCLLYTIAVFSKHDALKHPSEVWLSKGNLQFPRAKLLFLFLLLANWNQVWWLFSKNNYEF